MNLLTAIALTITMHSQAAAMPQCVADSMIYRPATCSVCLHESPAYIQAKTQGGPKPVCAGCYQVLALEAFQASEFDID